MFNFRCCAGLASHRGSTGTVITLIFLPAVLMPYAGLPAHKAGPQPVSGRAEYSASFLLPSDLQFPHLVKW